MSSSPRPETLRRWLAGWSLRARLVAALAGLFAVVGLLTGVATEVAVHQIQMRQLDSQLVAAENRSRGFPARTATTTHHRAVSRWRARPGRAPAPSPCAFGPPAR